MTKHSNSNSKFALTWLVLVLFFSGLLIKQFAFSSAEPIETNILKLLPENQQDPLAEQAFQQLSNSMSEQVLFMISDDSAKQAISAAASFESRLNQEMFASEQPLFSKILGQVSANTQSQWSDFYFQHRAQLLTEQQKQTLEHAPQSQVQYVIQSLYNPFSGVTATELSLDPFLLFRDYIGEVGKNTSNFTLQEHYLTTEFNGSTYVLITATLADSPYSLKTQQQLPKVDAIEQSIENEFGVEIHHTGVVFYADYGTQSAKSEINTIGLGSLAGVILLIWLTFRSALPLVLSLISIGTGLLVALASTVAIFGQVHLFSLVFGASLIGVSIDYSFHYLTDRLVAGSRWQSDKGLQHILIAISLGLVTSLIGYLGLLIAPFPGLQQLAMFSSIGLFAAYATVVCWYPLLAKRPSKDRPLPLASLLSAWLQLWNKPALRYALPTLIAAVSIVALTQIQYDDDIRQLQAMPETLKAQEQTITSVSRIGSSQSMLLVTAGNNQALLKSLQRLGGKLDQLVSNGTLSGYRSIHQLLPTTHEQKLNYQLVSELYRNQSQSLQGGLGWASFPELPPYREITVADFLRSPVSEPMRSLWLEPINGQQAAIVLLQDIQDPERFDTWLNNKETKLLNAKYLNKADEISSLFSEYRVKVLELLLVALAAIGLVLGWRYGPQRAIIMLLPSVIAGAAGLGVTVLVGSSINLFNLLGLILILGIGIDYTLFFAEQKKSLGTLLAISLSGITTLLSFGLLSLSQTHAIHSFGVTVLTGIFIAWLLAPMAIESEESPMHRRMKS